jgi:hypothetical protein
LVLGSKSQQILTLAWARSIWDFRPLGAKARAVLVDFSDALDVKPVREGTSKNDSPITDGFDPDSNATALMSVLLKHALTRTSTERGNEIVLNEQH